MDQSDNEANQDLSEDVNSQELDDWMLELHSNFPSAQIEVVSEPAKAPATNEKSEDLPTDEGLNAFQDDDTFYKYISQEIAIGQTTVESDEIVSVGDVRLIELEHGYGKSPHKDKIICEPGPSTVKMFYALPSSPNTGSNQNDENDPDFVPEIQESENSSAADDSLPKEGNEQQPPINEVLRENALDNNIVLGRVVKKRKRKGHAIAEEWFDNKNKRLREQGKEYVGWEKLQNGKAKRGKGRGLREIGPRCQGPGCARSLKTCNEITDEERQIIFKDFWQNLSWEQKKIYIASLVKCDLKKSTRNPETISRRKSTLIYKIKTPNGKEHRVCKTFFLNTFDLGEWTVRQWAADSTENSEGHAITPPQKQRPRRGFGDSNPTGKAKLVEFLGSLPKLPAHYCRRDSSRIYIEPIFGNRMSDLYAEYKRQCEDSIVPIKPLSTFTFYKVIESENLAFQQPKKDRCDTCVANDAGLVSEEVYNDHVNLKERARHEKRLDKDRAIEGTHFVITQDVQAVKVCPSLNASALYFKTKLACHNFSVYDMKSGSARCYWFNETQADLCAPTFASCVIDFLKDKWNKDTKIPIVIWSDGCTNQNHNSIMANALLSFSNDYNVEITQKFLEKGHTQMEVDSIHAVIENKIHNQPIHLPSDFIKIAASARSNPSPIEQKEVTFDFVKNFSQRKLLMYNSIRPGSKTGDPVVTDIRAIKYKSGNISVKIKSFDNDFFDLPKRKRRNEVASLSEFQQSHQAPLKITHTKWNHLQDLKAVIPSDCHPFYDSLPYE